MNDACPKCHGTGYVLVSLMTATEVIETLSEQEIRERLEKTTAESKSLRVLLRAVRARDRKAKPSPPKEPARGGGA